MSLSLRCTAAVLLTALGASAQELAKETPEQILAGCKPAAAPGGVQFMCEGIVATITQLEQVSVAAARDSQLGGIKASIKGDVTTTATSFTANGRSWPSTRLLVTAPGAEKPSFEGQLLAFEEPKGSARLVFCGASTSKPALGDRCKKILPLLAENGPAPFAVAQPEPKFLGKKVTIPEGCELVDSSEKTFRVGCGQTAFLYSMSLTSAAEITKVNAMVHEQLLKGVPGAVDGKERDCKVGGVATRCRVVKVGTVADGAVFYLGGAVVGEEAVSIQCAQPLGQKGVHPVCVQALGL